MIPNTKEIASRALLKHSVEKIREILDADSLGFYLPVLRQIEVTGCAWHMRNRCTLTGK
jgi:hypothetical protein